MVTKCAQYSADNNFGDSFQQTNAVNFFIGEGGVNASSKEFDALFKGCCGLTRKLPHFKFNGGGRCGWTALGTAASVGNVELVGHIYRKGVAARQDALEVGNDQGHTPLRCAAEEGQIRTATKLIELGANVNTEAKDGTTPIEHAANKLKNIALTTLLLSKGAIVREDRFTAEGTQILEKARSRLLVR